MPSGNERSINWERSILINGEITDVLVTKLTPLILQMRQESTKPITVGLDSPGGALSSMRTLMNLLTEPRQDGEQCQCITVAVSRAFSAAAIFLASGNYAVAHRHATIIFHDVRYSELTDVTPDKARTVAGQLQTANETHAQRLANKVIARLVWVYANEMDNFEEVRGQNKTFVDTFQSTLATHLGAHSANRLLDLPGFAALLMSKLNPENKVLIRNVVNRLTDWTYLNHTSDMFPSYRTKGTRQPGLLDGIRRYHHLFPKDGRGHFEEIQGDLKLFLCLLTAQISFKHNRLQSFDDLLSVAIQENRTIKAMNAKEHIAYASRLIVRFWNFFCGDKSATELSEDEKKQRMKQAEPYARLLWLFCLLLCRELYNGEHELTAFEAQYLGLVDEVAGGSSIQSIREYEMKHEQTGSKTDSNEAQS